MLINRVISILFVFLLLQTNNLSATTIDFQSIAHGVYDSLSFHDFTLTNLNGKFNVTDANPGDPIYYNCITSTYQSPNTISPFLVTFNNNANNVSYFSIGAGDFNVDSDDVYLEIFDSMMNRLGFKYYENPANKYGGGYLSLYSDTPIMYAKFWSAGQFPGSILWDNLSYKSTPSPVPLPSTLMLLLSGFPFLYASKHIFKKPK